MSKRKMSENSLKNLEKRKIFNSETALIAKQKSDESKKKKKEKKIILAALMEACLQLVDDETGEINAVAATKGLIEKAKNGDVAAYNAIRDILGQKPVDKQELTGNLQTSPPIINIHPIKADDKC